MDQPELDFHCEIEHRRAATIVRPKGELEHANIAGFRYALEDVAAARPDLVVVDLRGLTFADSTVLAVLINLRAALSRQHTPWELVRGSDPVHYLFEVTGLTRVLPFVTTTSTDPPERTTAR